MAKTPRGSPSSSPLHRFDSGLGSTVFLFLLAFRIANALALRTFFQPDEYFQSLEPAWDLVFGGGWITWEWRNHLRSFAHPSIFAALYYVIDRCSHLLGLSEGVEVQALVQAPRLLQAVFAAMGDYYTAKLAAKISGPDAGWTALWLSAGSAFHWFCATRTFSNSLEASITVVALYYWPWESSSQAIADKKDDNRSNSDNTERQRGQGTRISLLLAALACILRPTNALIWAHLGVLSLYHRTPLQRASLLQSAVLCGLGVLGVNALLDRTYVGTWVFPPLAFLKFNLLQSLSVFYGRNPWHYYLSQGLPLLLTSYIPLCVLSLHRSLRATAGTHTAQRQLAVTAAGITGIYSLIAHKEVRFLYPLLPALHVLCASTLASSSSSSSLSVSWTRTTKTRALAVMLALNMPIAYYAGTVHQRGVIDVITWLRDTRPAWRSTAFLMPCHSTSWRSSVGLITTADNEMWALGCEPPLGLSLEDRATYRDEADVFYDGLEVAGGASATLSRWLGPAAQWGWPHRVVVFEGGGVAEAMRAFLEKEYGAYVECARFWNSHVHDDWRRKGDVVVFCREDVYV